MKAILQRVLAATLVATLGLAAPAAAHADYVDQAPETVYTSGPMGPQNMDFDAENNMFKAHPGWIKDRLVHYYKFRMYTPSTYPETVPMGETNPDIPVVPIYLLTTDGGFGGIVESQYPIIRYHTVDGEDYSDFAEVHFVTVPANYTANTYRSVGDLTEANMTPTTSGIYVNAPVVPVGSTLEHPTQPGAAPINGVPVWYRGTANQVFFFETTDQAFADHYNPITRVGAAAQDGSGFEITVSPGMMNANRVRWEPIWHINQLFTGVTPGVNSGGPADVGQRNVIDTDRLDPNYSPLWQVWWISQVPPNYEADQASNAAVFTTDNGFEVIQTPMFVNCPNVGAHGGSGLNADRAESFEKKPFVSKHGQVTLEGALVMQADQTVTAFLGETELGSTTTNMMGGWIITVDGSELAPGDNTIEVKNGDGDTVATFTVEGQVVPAPAVAPVAALAAVGLAAVVVARGRRD